jgi:hypothetical protein
MKKTFIVQLATYEQVVVGICHSALWVYAALKRQEREAILIRNCTLQEFELLIRKHPGARFWCELASYPQQPLAELIWCKHNRQDVKFFGYAPLIRKLRLPPLNYQQEGIEILAGVFNYWKYEECGWEEIDVHLVEYCGQGEDFRPATSVFASIGCPNKCPYCHVGYDDMYPTGVMPLNEVCRAIDIIAERGFDIHWYDENFYRHPHIKEILRYLCGKGIKYVAMTDSVRLSEILNDPEIGQTLILESGNILNEIGIETVDPTVLRKNQELPPILNSDLTVLWLTVTFFPRETIQSLNMMGDFLYQYGLPRNRLIDYMQNSGTEAGLGQFFQFYDGIPWESYRDQGHSFDTYPVRLLPSFVGDPLLSEYPTQMVTLEDGARHWFNLYAVQDVVDDVLAQCTGGNQVKEIIKFDRKRLVALAQLARLQVIKST